MIHHPVVSQDEWLAARIPLLSKEKEFTRLRDELSRQRRALPWVRVEKPYVFDGPDGKLTLAELFGGRSQLIVYHFMFGPGWEEGCKSCSFLADHFDGSVVHLAHRDVTLIVVSRAPIQQIEAFKKRMGWCFTWVSSNGNDFNFDYHVSFTRDEMAKGAVYYNYHMGEFPSDEAPGLSVFSRDANGDIFHTYSSYARGLDVLVGAYNYLDLVPKGRDEDGLAFTMAWVRHHDRYDDHYAVDATEPYVPPKASEAVIRGLIEQRAQAVRAKDVDAVMSHYAPDLVSFDLAPPLELRGPAANRRSWADWFPTFRGPVGYEIRELSVTTGDDVAFCHSLNRISGARTDGTSTDVWVRATVCYRRIDGKWLITHEHTSVPFYMEPPFKAAIDLEP